MTNKRKMTATIWIDFDSDKQASEVLWPEIRKALVALLDDPTFAPDFQVLPASHYE